MRVLLVNTGLSNVRSVKRAVEECGHDCFIAKDISDISKSSHVIIPGVGSFSDASKILSEAGWADTLKEFVGHKGLPLLGICLGMQLLLSEGHEHGKSEGLDFIPGKVVKMKDNNLRIPHVGWNEITYLSNNPILNNIPSGADFYFVHSYHAQPDDAEHVLATVPYGHNYAAIIGRENIWGTQFHPEKSGAFGFKILENFLQHA
jgi:glutamine amidotransferase